MITYLSRKLLASTIAALLVVAWAASPIAFRSVADNRPAEDRGAMALGQAIKRLGVVASVLHTGAHPDDEDSGLLAYLARGRQARTAYMSLTRGDGGQNLIGPELYEALGVIRTEELLAARRLDGAQQFFSRAFDFGFSKSRTETLQKWDREAVLSDMVRVIRAYRPLVIVSAWSGTPNDGHGHHQAAGLLTQEAYRAAADPSRFPQQMREGLRPWQTKKLYIRSFDGAASPREFLPSLSTLSLNTGEFDPLLGRSYYEIAARGRSQHRSQDQGTIEARGPRFSRLRLIDSKLGPIKNEKDIFEDMNVRLTGIADYAGAAAAKVKEQLTEVQAAADEAMAKYNPLSPSSVAAVIARGLKRLRETTASLATLGLNESQMFEIDFLLKQKVSDFEDALARSEGIVVDCLADDEVVTPGQTFNVTLNAYADSSAKLAGFGLVAESGWTLNKKSEKTSEVAGRLVLQAEYSVTAGPDVAPTQPYWLRSERKGDTFKIDSPAKGATGIEPVSPSALRGVVDFEIDGAHIKTSQEAEHRYADRALGEIRHALKVAPAVSVSLSPGLLVVPSASSGVEPVYRAVELSITNNASGPEKGIVRLELPSGVTGGKPAINGEAGSKRWLSEISFDLKRKNERMTEHLLLAVSPGAAEDRRAIRASAFIEGKEYASSYQAVSYPHIEPRFIYQEAKTEAEIIDVKVAPGLKVGYIEGSGDDFGAALKRIGVDVKTIDSKELASGDLSVYDTIVAGVRVYEVRPDVNANNSRLMDYVNRGGTYIVQYSRGNFETGGFAPYRIGREDAENARQPAQRGRQQDREPRLLYLSDVDIAKALTTTTAKPRVGYIGAAGDALLASTKNAGLDAKLIEASEIGGDLSQFDVIVVGSNSGSRRELAEYNSQLLDYSRRKLVVLAYTQAQYLSGDFATFPKPESRPFRVTDENATVTILEPDHPRFNFPNKITQRDFDGWVQERGAYFLSGWDAHFKPLMACHDPGEPDLKGGELIAEYGKGLYVYTAYAWFRQLPKGVPGAYRLIANLVSLPKSGMPRGQSSR